MSLFYLLEILLLLAALVAVLVLRATRWRSWQPLRWLLQQQNEQLLPPRAQPLPPPSYQVEPPLVSLVLPCMGQAAQLERHLEAWLGQEQARYEVIVADAAQDESAAHQVVQRFQAQHPHLRYTRVPATARALDLRMAVLTLGIRAARAPWVVLTQPDCAPPSAGWLPALFAHCTPERDVVLGRVVWEDLGCEDLRTSYEQLRRLALEVACTQGGWPCGGDARCMALRVEWWRSCGGFAEGLDWGYGECALLVDAYAQSDRVGWALTADTAVRQDIPEGEELMRLRRESSRLRRALRSRRARTFVADRVASWTWGGLWLVALLWGGLRTLWLWGGEWTWWREWCLQVVGEVPLHAHWHWLLDAALLLLLLWACCGTVRSARATLQGLLPEYRGTSVLYPLLFDTLLPWRRTL